MVMVNSEENKLQLLGQLLQVKLQRSFYVKEGLVASKRGGMSLQWQGRCGRMCKFDILGLIYICLNFLIPCFKVLFLPYKCSFLAQEIRSVECGAFNCQPNSLSLFLCFNLTFLAIKGDEELILNFHEGS